MTPIAESPDSDARIKAAAAAWVARRDAGMSAADQRDFECWLAVDPRNRAALDYFDGAWSALAAPSRSGAAWELERELERLAKARRRRWMTTTTAAAALLVAGFLAWLPEQRVPNPVPSSAIVAVPRVETLPDGSAVELNADSEIRVHYTGDARRVTLRRGQAHFAVVKDPLRPFVVSAGGLEVRAVGTAFEVQIAPAAVAILVTEGRVAVERSSLPEPVRGVARTTAGELHAAAAPAQPITILDAGHQLLIDFADGAPVSAPRTVSPDEFADRQAWRGPHLEFTRTPLADAIALFNRHAPPGSPRLVISDATLAAVPVSGVFRPSNIGGFVVLLESGFGVKAERLGNTITLRPVE